VFDINDPSAGYQRSMIVEIAPKQEDCFFIDGITTGHMLNVHWNVLNTGNQGQSMDITMYIRNPVKNLVTYAARQTEGKKIGLEMTVPGDYEVCFSNRYSVYYHKKLFWQYEIEGMEDAKKERNRKDLEILAEFAEDTFNVDKATKNLRFQLRSVMQSLWWFGSIRRRHINRMEKIKAMITNWSFFLMAGIAIIGIGQVWMIRSFFNVKPATSRMKTRT